MGMKMLLKQLYPKKVIASVYELDWTELSARYAGVIFDIDNTLVPQDAPADDKVIGLFQAIHGLGMKTMLLS
ncbi:MAG: YqeG family HAD IIIA-type phosphatase, partial [Kineothrix sp.]|nr:YqeG family HAD IIIA-type phosphatase [Kineothrix sp.]